MTVTTDTDRTTDPTAVVTSTNVAVTTPAVAPRRANAFPRRATEHSPNLATLDMLRSSGRNPLLLPATRRARPTRQRECGSSA